MLSLKETQTLDRKEGSDMVTPGFLVAQTVKNPPIMQETGV